MTGDTTKLAPVSARDGVTIDLTPTSIFYPISFATLPPSIVEFPAATYTDKVAMGIELVKRKEDCQWGLGDLALSVMTSHDESSDLTLRSYALDVNVKLRTMQSYVQVSRYWLPEQRDEWPNLSYSHYKAAMNAYPVRQHMAIEAMNYASSLDRCSVAEFEDYMKKIKAAEADRTSERELLLSDLLARCYHIMQTLMGADKEILGEIRATIGLRLGEE